MTDAARVEALLGRSPRGRYEVVVRDQAGDPVVLRNAPLLDDGTPMPTRYWLIGPDESRRIGQLEAEGGVDAAEAAVDPAELLAAHARYAAERDAEIPVDHTGPRPSGGVGGTRVGVKCLHAHWAWYLAGGDDPVGRWIDRRLRTTTVTIEPERLSIAVAGSGTATVPWGPDNLTEAWLAAHDPPWAEDLTNAIGAVADHLEDVEREHPPFAHPAAVAFSGPAVTALARLELGHDQPPANVELDRRAAEEVFRLVATEPVSDRAHNPGLPSAHVGTIVATSVIVVAVMRSLDLAAVTLDTRAAV